MLFLNLQNDIIAFDRYIIHKPGTWKPGSEKDFKFLLKCKLGCWVVGLLGSLVFHCGAKPAYILAI